MSHNVIPVPEPGIAWGNALKGGYIVHPAEAGPVSTHIELISTTVAIAKNQ